VSAMMPEIGSRLYMLDTNICSFHMRSRPAIVTERLAQVTGSGAAVAISAMVYSELRDGVLKPTASPTLAGILEQFLECISGVMAWDKAAADQTALVRQALRRAGTPISPNDAAIAGHALALGATLVTNNIREFARVLGLRVEDWTAPRGDG